MDNFDLDAQMAEPMENLLGYRPDSVVLDLYRELIEFALKAREEFSEGQFQAAYEQLYDLISCTELILEGMSASRPVQKHVLPRRLTVPSFDSLLDHYYGDKTETAFEELTEMLEATRVCMSAFCFAQPSPQFLKDIDGASLSFD